MRTETPPELPIFRSALQARLLTLMLLDPEERWTFGDLRDRTGASHGSLHRELGRLEGAGLLESERIGRSRLFRVATSSPAFEPLSELVLKTTGVEALLRQALTPLRGVETAAIFGSWARGEIQPESDVDVLVVGDVEFADLARAVRDVERATAREVSLVAFRPGEFRERVRERGGFATEILSGELKMLVGTMEPHLGDAS